MGGKRSRTVGCVEQIHSNHSSYVCAHPADGRRVPPLPLNDPCNRSDQHKAAAISRRGTGRDACPSERRGPTISRSGNGRLWRRGQFSRFRKVGRNRGGFVGKSGRHQPPGNYRAGDKQDHTDRMNERHLIWRRVGLFSFNGCNSGIAAIARRVSQICHSKASAYSRIRAQTALERSCRMRPEPGRQAAKLGLSACGELACVVAEARMFRGSEHRLMMPH